MISSPSHLRGRADGELAGGRVVPGGKTSLGHPRKNQPPQVRDPAYVRAFARLNASLAQASTLADLTEAEKTELWVRQLWGKSPEASVP